MNVLNSREWAVIFWFAVLVVFAQVKGGGVLGAVLGGVRALLAPAARKVLFSLVLVHLWLLLVVLAAERLGVWGPHLLKDTVILVLVTGAPAIFLSFQAAEQDHFYRTHIFGAARFWGLVAVLLNLKTFPFMVEVPLQAALAILFLSSEYALTSTQHARAKNLVDGVLAAVGIVLIAGTTYLILRSWDSLDLSKTAESLALAVWLPVSALLFVMVFAPFVAYEDLFHALRRSSRDVRRRVLVATVLELRGRARLAHDLKQTATFHPELARAKSVRTAREVLQIFKVARLEKIAAAERKEEDLRRLAGRQGPGPDGLALDKREIPQTRKALEWIATCHLGHHRNLGSFRPDLMRIVKPSQTAGLPDPHGIEMKVRADGQAWSAWRRTPSGLVLGIGATGDPSEWWMYEGWQPPAHFPAAGKGWWLPFDTPPHWALRL